MWGFFVVAPPCGRRNGCLRVPPPALKCAELGCPGGNVLPILSVCFFLSCPDRRVDLEDLEFGRLDLGTSIPVNEVLNQVWLNWEHSSLQSWISRYFVSSYYPWVINVLAPKGRSKTSPKLFQTLYSIDLCINKINTSCGRPGDRTYGIFVKLELSTKKSRLSSAQNQTIIL